MRGAILLLAFLALAPDAGMAQRAPAPAFAAAVEAAPADSLLLRRPARTETVAPERGEFGKQAAKGALYGGALGAGVFLLFELSDDHTDHSYDEYVAIMITLVGAAAGTVVGLLTAL